LFWWSFLAGIADNQPQHQQGRQNAGLFCVCDLQRAPLLRFLTVA
jgi:hypothetical protein